MLSHGGKKCCADDVMYRGQLIAYRFEREQLASFDRPIRIKNGVQAVCFGETFFQHHFLRKQIWRKCQPALLDYDSSAQLDVIHAIECLGIGMHRGTAQLGAEAVHLRNQIIAQLVA